MKKDETVLRTEANEMTEAQRAAIVYHSKLLNKYYESYDDMLREEAEFKRQHDEELKAKEEKQHALDEIKKAYTNYVNLVDEKNKVIAEAWKNFSSLREEFIKKYGYFHMSYYDDGKTKELSLSDVVDEWNRIWTNLPTLFK